MKLQKVRSIEKGKRARKKLVHVQGPSESEPELGLFFIDSVLENAGTQDTMVTASATNAIYVRLKRELPELDEVVVVFRQCAKLCQYNDAFDNLLYIQVTRTPTAGSPAPSCSAVEEYGGCTFRHWKPAGRYVYPRERPCST